MVTSFREAFPILLRAPPDEPWGERRTTFRDPDGHTLHVAQTL